MLNIDTKLTLDEETINSPNLTKKFSAQDLATIGNAVYTGYTKDKQSRYKWELRMNAAMDLALQIQEPKNFPWPQCSNVVFPLVTIAALQFSARAYTNIIKGTNVVRYRTIGKADLPSLERAYRIGKHMSWQVLEQDESWEEQHDRLFINLAVVGSCFVKTYYNATKGYPISEMVMAKDLVVDYFAPSIESAARKTHRIPLYRNEVYERAARGTFHDVRQETWFNQSAKVVTQNTAADNRSGTAPPASTDEYTPYHFLEQHTWFDFDHDGYAEPYTITIEESSKMVVRIVSRIESDDDIERVDNKIVRIKASEYFTKYSFIPSPDGGIYDLGFGVFLGPINEAVNSGINQIIDQGTMQSSLGGFLGRGAKIRGGVYTLAPWEWKRVDSTGDDLKKNLVPFPERQPSEVMFKLIGLLIEYANRVAGTVDATVGENPGQNTPASTFQGMTENGLQVYGMIFKRVWRCMKTEFKRRYELNKVFLRAHEDFGSGTDFIRREDYLGNPDQVAPVADPRLTSVTMSIQQALMLKQSAMSVPGYDMAEVEHRFLNAAEVDGIDQVYPGPGKVPPGHEAPNPKASVEMLKLQGKQMQVKAEQMKWANQLMETQRVNTAKIALLEAQAMQAAADTNAINAAAQIEAFDGLIKAHKEYGKQINDRIQALTAEGSKDGQDSGEGGAGGMASASSNQGGNAVPPQMPASH
jgi:chaperonin GroES